MSNNKHYIYQPLILSIILALGIFIGSKMNSGEVQKSDKLSNVVDLILNEYVDSLDRRDLEEKAIQSLITNLDPHSSYIPPRLLQGMNDDLKGKFEGVGIQFEIQKDTIYVVTPISGGPSEKLGIMSGDRIITIDDENVAGIGITNEDVIGKLRGEKGTEVRVGIMRNRKSDLIDFNIIRDEIPLYSVDISYIIQPNTGYIKVNRFSSKTHDEFYTSLKKLHLSTDKLENLILDLRGNPGGSLKAAIMMCDELLEAKKMIVFTDGNSRDKDVYYAQRKGLFEKGNIYILVDEGSASASEIVAGAIQDNDRGTIIGRRTFGKGLVQTQKDLEDGSGIRLTIARYYTPTGRCIQKSYENGNDDYYLEAYKRFESGELDNKDSVHFNDSLKFVTPKGKVVYGGGGIMPDIFVPYDTSGMTDYYTELVRGGHIRQFAFEYADNNREYLNGFETLNDFDLEFSKNENILKKFISYAESKGVKTNEEQLNKSKEIINTQLEALIARHIFSSEGFYPIINRIDNVLEKTLEIINEK